MTSVAADAPGIDQVMTSAEWLAVAGYPEARFEVRELSHIGRQRFAGTGELTLKGITAPVPFDISLGVRDDPDGPVALAVGTATVRRTAFGVGLGAGPGLASAEVEVDILIRARPENE